MPTTPPPSLNPLELGRTTERLAQLDAKTLLAPHFGVRTDVAGVLEGTKKKTEEWVTKVRALKNAGRTLDEVAAMLGITPKVAQRRHAAALRKLHQLLVGRRKKGA